VLPLAGEERALSFGALYHPWTVTGDEDQPGELVAVPPDGAAAGIMARRALARGAWVAPANEPLEGVVALVPDLPAASRQLLQDGRVNTARQEPAGFLWLSADTLSDDPDLRQVSVRRLLSLLRRVALRHGPTYVFEANDEALRRRLRRGFEALLTDLLGRGAFAGTTPEESFQVVTAAPAATPRAVEEGRLVVELKVAPSIPMRFLTVRLVNSGETLRTEGV
jgi:phage tail sheath protein FI